jgi:hypothetical protein
MHRRNKISRVSALMRRLESPPATTMATPKLDAVDFGSEARPRNGYVALFEAPDTEAARCVTPRLR